MKDPKNEQILPTQKLAESTSLLLGCSGSHRVDGGWAPCESPAHLDALINGGVAKYRLVRNEKGLIGRAIGAVRGANAPSPGKRKRGKKVRKASFDPNARDADADKLVQEGTTQERTVGAVRKAPKVDPAKAKKPVKRNKLTASKVVADPVAKRTPKMELALAEADRRLEAAGALGRPRGKADGATPEAKTQANIIRRKVERKFGKVQSLDDIERALGQAFPNASIYSSHMSPVGDLPEGWAEAIIGSIGVRKFPNDQMFVDYIGGEEAMEAYRGFVHGVLAMSIDDPSTAELVGSFRLMPNTASAVGAAGLMGTNSVKSPITLFYSPGSGGASIKATGDDDVILKLSALAVAQAEDPKKFSGGKALAIPYTTRVTDGDAFAYGAAIAGHEWGHMAGYATEHAKLDVEEMANQVNSWIKDGKSNSVVKLPSGKTVDLNAPFLRIAAESDSFLEGMRDPVIKEEARIAFEAIGFKGIDINNVNQVLSAYRAITVRGIINRELFDATMTVSNGLPDKTWLEMGKISSYGLSDPEEAVAEAFGLMFISPYTAMGKFRSLYEDPIIAERFAK